MLTTPRLMPRQLVPDLSATIVGGPRWRLCDQKPKHFTMLIFYRGRHCPECRSYLLEAQGLLADFRREGVSVIAVSSDSAERGAATEADWGLTELPLGYGLTIAQARAWGLYVSSGHGQGLTPLGLTEPEFFVEPGLFLIRPDHTLFFAAVQNMPFARPPLAEVLRMVQWSALESAAARGEATAAE